MEHTKLERSDYMFVRNLGEPVLEYWVQCHQERQVSRAELERIARWLRAEAPEEASQLETLINKWYGKH